MINWRSLWSSGEQNCYNRNVEITETRRYECGKLHALHNMF